LAVKTKKTGQIVREDGLLNALNLVGTKRDPGRHYRLKPEYIFATPQALEEKYMAGGLLARIVDILADEPVKSWIELEDDTSAAGDVLGLLEDLNAEGEFADALRWRNLQGGGAVVMRIDDGQTWDSPLDEKNIRRIECLTAMDMTDIVKKPGAVYQDEKRPDFGRQEFYTVMPESGMPYDVHESRALIFAGDRLPRFHRQLYSWQWGQSAAVRVYEAVLQFARANNAGLNALERISQLVIGIPNLTEKLATAEGEELVAKRLETVDMSRNILNSIAADREEVLALLNAQLTRVPEVMAHIWQIVSTVSGIPVTKLFGQAPAGFNSTGESDMENWYSEVRKIQRRVMRKPLERLIRLIYLSKEGPTKGREPKAWKMTFSPLWLPSQKEQAETGKINADARQIYMTNQVLYPEEVRGMLKAEGVALNEEFDSIGDREPGAGE